VTATLWNLLPQSICIRHPTSPHQILSASRFYTPDTPISNLAVNNHRPLTIQGLGSFAESIQIQIHRSRNVATWELRRWLNIHEFRVVMSKFQILGLNKADIPTNRFAPNRPAILIGSLSAGQSKCSKSKIVIPACIAVASTSMRLSTLAILISRAPKRRPVSNVVTGHIAINYTGIEFFGSGLCR
jgi:hypothetical protein